MNKYYVTEIGKNDEFTMLVTKDKQEAIERARDEDYINKRDKNQCLIEIRVYVEDIENENCTCFDYNVIDY